MGKVLFQRTEFRPGAEWALGRDRVLRFSLSGNFELWQISGPKLLWESGTLGDSLMMQGDGNLVIYKEAEPIWSSGTFDNPDAILAVDEEGYLEILTPDLEMVLWSSEEDEAALKVPREPVKETTDG